MHPRPAEGQALPKAVNGLAGRGGIGFFPKLRNCTYKVQKMEATFWPLSLTTAEDLY